MLTLARLREFVMPKVAESAKELESELDAQKKASVSVPVAAAGKGVGRGDRLRVRFDHRLTPSGRTR